MTQCKQVDTAKLDVRYTDTRKNDGGNQVLEKTATFTLPACGNGAAHEIKIKADLQLGGVKVQIDSGTDHELLYSGRNNFTQELGKLLDCKIGSVDRNLRAEFYRRSLEIHDDLGVLEQNPETLTRKLLAAESMPKACITPK